MMCPLFLCTRVPKGRLSYPIAYGHPDEKCEQADGCPAQLCHEYDIFAMNMIFDLQGIRYAHIKKLTFIKRGQADDVVHACLETVTINEIMQCKRMEE